MRIRPGPLICQWGVQGRGFEVNEADRAGAAPRRQRARLEDFPGGSKPGSGSGQGPAQRTGGSGAQ